VPFTALIAGDGPERARLERDLAEHAVTASTRLLGAVANDEIRRLLQATDVFFLPSSMEGLSLAIYEAMACGTCVVGAAVGGQPELVVAGTGVLIPRGTPDEEAERYAQEIERLIRHPRRRRAMARAARARVARHFPLAALGQALQRVLSGGAPTTVTRARQAQDAAVAHATAAVEMTRLESFLQTLWHEREARAALERSAGR
jgi:glycosyltransferase involved in cell wall biosynthesis